LDTILPESFRSLLAGFRPCFTAPSYHNFVAIVAGWVHCLGRRTVTAVALASGGLDLHHISVFHRFFGRARWALDALGHVLFTLALAWVPADQPLLVLLDDTLARKGGKGISLTSMHHDPLLSTARKPFFSHGHVWVTLALWVPLPLGDARGFALPLLFRLYTGSKRGGQADAPAHPTKKQRPATATAAIGARPTKLQLARDLIALLARWSEGRTIYLVADSAYAGRTLLEQRPEGVHVLSRLRMDAALWTPPPARAPGQKGRPRRRGCRLPAPQELARTRQHWHHLPLQLYGRSVTTQAFQLTALWYVALRAQPVRIVVVRDPAARRRDEAFFCTDLGVRASFVLESYARRWTLEVAFHDGKQYLGFEDPQNQTEQAVQRTAPMAFLVYDLVLLWSASRVQAGEPAIWLRRPWDPHKTAPSFRDLLITLRRDAWRQQVFDPPSALRMPQKWLPSWAEALLETA
jgi:catechol 2,3-dioxygenase-like lactoylglutathione lyase family enzyme